MKLVNNFNFSKSVVMLPFEIKILVNAIYSLFLIFFIQDISILVVKIFQGKFTIENHKLFSGIFPGIFIDWFFICYIKYNIGINIKTIFNDLRNK